MITSLPVLRSGSLLRPFLGELFAELDAINSFSDSSHSLTSRPRSFPLDVAEHTDRYVVTADLAGVRKEEVEITLNGDRLFIEIKPQIEVQSSRDAEVTYIIRERRIGAMSRTIRLPYITSERNIDASMKDGVLTVAIEKDAALIPKKITVH